jgi:hypothetical protein
VKYPEEKPEKEVVEMPSEMVPEEEITYEESMPEPSKKLGAEDCVSNYVCGEWSECRVMYNFKDIAEEEVFLEGKQTRNCQDMNKCQYDRTEAKVCDTKNTVIAKKVGDYVEVYDKNKELLVSRLRVFQGKLNIQIPLDKNNYEPHCFDGIANNGEDEIDCYYTEKEGCPVCTKEMPSIRADSVLMYITLTILILSCLFLSSWYVYLGKKIKKRKGKILNMSKFRGDEQEHRKENKREALPLMLIFVLSVLFLIYANYSLSVTGKAISNSESRITVPEVLRECYYTKYPNCTDNIQNCHHESCEVRVDCGGPCEPCPETCYDGLKNQGEFGIDCGGPCEPCFVEFPLETSTRSFFYISLIILLLIIILMIRLVAQNKEAKEKLNEFLNRTRR